MGLTIGYINVKNRLLCCEFPIDVRVLNSIKKQGLVQVLSDSVTCTLAPQSTDVQMDVKNAVGQVIFTQILRGVQIGTVELNTQGWANNIYIVEMRFGKETIRQKLVVQR